MRIWNETTIKVASVLSLSISLGIILYALYYANFTSYLSDDPQACVNCHVMQKHYITWQAASHKNVATCNDCHLPQKDIIRKYFAKADNGFKHAFNFTLGNYPTNIIMNNSNYNITNENCISCHKNMTEIMHLSNKNIEPINCTHCHRNIGHQVTSK